MDECNEILSRIDYLVSYANCVIDRKVTGHIKNNRWGLESYSFNGFKNLVDFEVELFNLRENLFSFIKSISNKGEYENQIAHIINTLWDFKRGFEITGSGTTREIYNNLISRDITGDAPELVPVFIDDENGFDYGMAEGYIYETFHDEHFSPYIDKQYEFLTELINSLSQPPLQGYLHSVSNSKKETAQTNHFKLNYQKKAFEINESLSTLYQNLQTLGSQKYLDIPQKKFIDFFKGYVPAKKITWKGYANELHYLIKYIINQKYVVPPPTFWQEVCDNFTVRGELLDAKKLSQNHRINSDKFLSLFPQNH